jgi:thiol-disulfide isomerase/thioredoxin
MIAGSRSMRVRWVIAAVSALALALLTFGVPLPVPTVFDGAKAAGAPACPANAKPANLNFTLKDTKNRDVKLSDFRGKVILLDFWATWCIPCKVEIPWFVEFQTKYGKQGLQVIGISVDDTLDKLRPYIPQLKMTYVVLQGPGTWPRRGHERVRTDLWQSGHRLDFARREDLRKAFRDVEERAIRERDQSASLRPAVV